MEENDQLVAQNQEMSAKMSHMKEHISVLETEVTNISSKYNELQTRSWDFEESS